jgi:hypothetical protein
LAFLAGEAYDSVAGVEPPPAATSVVLPSATELGPPWAPLVPLLHTVLSGDPLRVPVAEQPLFAAPMAAEPTTMFSVSPDATVTPLA